jgi:hypothetical protein
MALDTKAANREIAIREALAPRVLRDRRLPTLVDGDASKLRIAYVPTAAGPEAESQFWVKADREQLNRLGCGTVTPATRPRHSDHV